MTKIKIGVPRALLYYKYGVLWETFFHELGYEVIISPCTNKEILSKGQALAIDESCLALKIYLGHVAYLVDKVDYVLVPRIFCLKKREKMCTNFYALYDLVNNSFPFKAIDYNIDLEQGLTEQKAFLKMGKKLKQKPALIKKAYRKALRIEKRKQEHQLIKQEILVKKSPKLKIILVGHPYNIYDELVGKRVIKLLEDEGVTIIYADLFKDYKTKQYQLISKQVYWTYSKELLEALRHYYEQVDGIILLSVFPCGPDSLTNEMCLRKLKEKPIINIIIDELTGEAGLQTRIESFIDIIKYKREELVKNGKNN